MSRIFGQLLFTITGASLPREGPGRGLSLQRASRAADQPRAETVRNRPLCSRLHRRGLGEFGIPSDDISLDNVQGVSENTDTFISLPALMFITPQTLLGARIDP